MARLVGCTDKTEKQSLFYGLLMTTSDVTDLRFADFVGGQRKSMAGDD